MLNIKPNEREFLESIFKTDKGLFAVDTLDELFAADTINAILNPLDWWIGLNGFDDNGEFSDDGRKAQRIYDSLYANNLK